MSNLLNRISDLSPDEIIQLKQRLAPKQSHSPAEVIAPTRGRKKYPLSYAQERLWFLDQFQPASAIYNIPTAIEINAALNVRAVEEALQELLRRHEVLRTSFSNEDGGPVQVVHPRVSFKLQVEDLRSLSEGERVAAAQRLADEEARQPFDLTLAPLLRARLLQLAEHRYVLLLTMHHIISDGWSMAVFFSEYSTLYEAYCQGRRSPLPELPLQYANYAVWQRQWLQGAVIDEQLHYWKQQLASMPELLELPTDHLRPPVQSFRGGWQAFVLGAAVSRRLRELSQQQGATLFMTLLSAWQILLLRYSGREDIVVGTPIAGRNREETEKLIGFFVNTLVLRSRLQRHWSFREVLAHVREVCLEAYAHQDLPFEKLVEELQPERNLSHNPLFQITFVLQNMLTTTPQTGPGNPGETAPAGSFTAEVGTSTAKFDLTLSVTESGDYLTMGLEYSTDLFEAATISRLAQHFQTLLEGITNNPEQPISQLPLLTAAEREQMLREWNNTSKPYQPQCVHELFETQAAQRPQQTAVLFRQEQVSYEELNARANQLAWYLRELGVGPEVKVGLCLERGIEALLAILGILKAGGAYVPLDPEYPRERLSFMLTDAGVKVLLTQEHLVQRLPTQGAANILSLEKIWEAVAKNSRQNPNRQASADNLAYVVYTSGSTGRPKGVAMTHHALSNLLSWQLSHPTLSCPRRTLQYASLSFDVSFQEIFTTLCSGANLVIAPAETRHDFAELLRDLDRAEVERLFIPPAVLQQLEFIGDSLPTPRFLRQLITAGEQLKLSEQLIRYLAKLGCTLHNHYGPSESHVVTQFEMSGSPADWPRLPPIGKPINNTQVYILDEEREPVPIGVRGELYIGGVGVARGYLNRPELTAERFIPDPFSAVPGARLYRTGDMVRYLPAGNIEFLGRVDQQVKLRGFRIELGEIETVLSRHPAVTEAVVTVREETAGDKRLVAYILSPAGATVSLYDLRSYVQQQLPQHMIPATFVLLEQWPLTANGKVDRQALPAPGTMRPELEQQYEPPRNAIEETVAAIWAEVLKVERVGVTDNFFDLGGHSLLATQVVSRIRTLFQLELPLRRIFEAPIVSALSLSIAQACLSQADEHEATLALNALQENGRG